MRVIKRKDAGRYERITGANGGGKQQQIRGRHRPRRGVALVVRAARPEHALLRQGRRQALKDYALVDIHARTDIISFPVH